jgi:hypothetical protein
MKKSSARNALMIGGAVVAAAGVGLGLTYALYRPAEVYHVRINDATSIPSTDAAKVAALFGGQVATLDQLTAAQKAGAEWCKSGWVMEAGAAQPKNGYYPTQTLPIDPATKKPTVQCGAAYMVNMCNPEGGCVMGVTIFGKKPSKAEADKSGYSVQPWSSLHWMKPRFIYF